MSNPLTAKFRLKPTKEERREQRRRSKEVSKTMLKDYTPIYRKMIKHVKKEILHVSSKREVLASDAEFVRSYKEEWQEKCDQVKKAIREQEMEIERRRKSVLLPVFRQLLTTQRDLHRAMTSHLDGVRARSDSVAEAQLNILRLEQELDSDSDGAMATP